jgi:transposase
VQELEGENARLCAENQQLKALVESLEQRIEQLSREAYRQAAPFRRQEKDKKPPDQRGTPGRPAGHPPAHRPRPPYIDDDIEVLLEACPRCHGPVQDLQRREQFIEDLPPIRPHVSRLVTYTGTCPQCGEVQSTHPIQVSTAVGAAGTHLGTRAVALAALLNKHLGLTLGSTRRVLKVLGGLSISRGGLVQAMHRVADKTQAALADVVAGLRASPAVHADETSWWVGGPGWWLWVFTANDGTLYRVDESRGRAVVTETLGPDFGGVVVSDCLATYDNLPYPQHKCYAHHLKAIAEARDAKPPCQRGWLDEVAGLLKAAMMLGRLRTGLPPPQWAECRRNLDARADALILPGRTDPVEERVANRLRKQRQWLFTFLDRPGVEATNNRAERALRPGVIARKLSCGNKTVGGKRTWETLGSLAATCAQRGQDFVEFLRPYLVLAPQPATR